MSCCYLIVVRLPVIKLSIRKIPDGHHVLSCLATQITKLECPCVVLQEEQQKIPISRIVIVDSPVYFSDLM